MNVQGESASSNLDIQEFTWQEVRTELLELNEDFVKLVDQISPDKNHTLFKVKYPYGSEILKKGKFYLPRKDGKLVAFDDLGIDDRIRSALGYNLGSNPVAIVLNNSLELFAEQPDRTLPLGGLIGPGALFGLFRILTHGKQSNQPKFIWNMTAGARSVFMLPKVAEREKFKRLKRTFNLSSDKPKSLLDHWVIFKEIANNPDFEQSWNTELLFFSKEWFEHFDDVAWQSFNYHLYQRVWIGSDFWRNQFVWNLIFSIIQKEIEMRPNSFIADTTKGLFAIAVGGSPGFAAATDNFAGPIEGLQRVYHEVYGLKNYLPIIMQPYNFKLIEDNPRPVYYSLQFPTAIEFGPKSSKHASLLTDLYNLEVSLVKYLELLRENKFNIEETSLFKATQEVDFDFFHATSATYEGINDTKFIAEQDPSFYQVFDKAEEAEFPAASAFLKACVRISKKKD